MRTSEAESVAEDEEDDEHLPMTLKQAFQKLRVLNLVVGRGVMHSHMQDWAYGGKFQKARSRDQESFIASILRSTPLMQQATLAMQSLQPNLLMDGTEGAAELLDNATKALHRIKICTAHTCWYDHVSHLKEEVMRLSLRRDEVLRQWKEARVSYLKEVSHLREQARIRGDPQEYFNTDVEFFFDPSSTLEPDERKFLAEALSEKMKMMMETNPKVVRTFDLGQLEKLMQQVDSQECADLKKALKQKTQEAADAKKALHDWQTHLRHVAAPQGDSAGKLVGMLEVQVQDLRSKAWEHEHAVELLNGEVKDLQAERDKLVTAWKDESSRGLLQQKELERLESSQQQTQALLEAAEAECKQLEGQLADAAKQMQSLAQATLELDAAAKEPPGASSSPSGASPIKAASAPRPRKLMKGLTSMITADALADGLEGDARAEKPSKPVLLPLEVAPVAELQKEAGDVAVDAQPKGRLLPLGGAPASEAPAEEAATEAEAEQPSRASPLPLDAAGSGEAPMEVPAEGGEALAEELQRALAANKALEEKCEELEALLRSHVEALSVQKADVALVEAENIAEFAESLGCVSHQRTSNGIRICPCGNLLMNDAAFCRKCGSEWREENTTAKDSVMELGQRFATLDEAHQKAVQELHSLLHPGQESQRRPPLAVPGAGEAGGAAGEGRSSPDPCASGAAARAAGAARPSPEPRAAGGSRAASRSPPAGPRRAAPPASPKAAAAAAAGSGNAARSSATVEQLQEEVDRLEREKANTEAQILIELAQSMLEDTGDEPEEGTCNCGSGQMVGLLRQVLVKMRLLCTQMMAKLKSAALENVKMSSALSCSRELLEVASRAVGDSMEHVGGLPDRRLLEGLRAIEESKRRCVFYRLFADARVRQMRQMKLSKMSTLGEAAWKTLDGDHGSTPPCKFDSEGGLQSEAQLAAPPDAEAGAAPRGGSMLTITQIQPPLSPRKSSVAPRPAPPSCASSGPLRSAPQAAPSLPPGPPEVMSSPDLAQPAQPHSVKARTTELSFDPISMPPASVTRRASRSSSVASVAKVHRQRASARADEARLPQLAPQQLVVSSRPASRCQTPSEPLPEELGPRGRR